MANITFFLHKIGPYHHARFKYLSKYSNLTVVEILPDSKEYDWNDIKETNDYKIVKIKEHKNGKEQKGKCLQDIVKNIFLITKPDLCIVTGWDNRTYFAALLEAKKNSVPISCISDSTYNDVPRNAVKEKIKSIIIDPFDAFLVAGSLSKDYLTGLNVKAPIFQPWDVIDNNYFSDSVNKFLEHKRPDHLPKKYLLCVSRFIEKKNLISLIESYKNYINKNKFSELSLVMVGSGPLKSNLEQAASDLLNNKIHIFSFAQYDQLPEFYAFSHAFILPSKSDQWGLVINEAMASGKPVIVSNRCGCSADLVKDGVNGFVCEPLNVSIEEKIRSIDALNESQLKKIALLNKSILESFSLEKFSESVIGIHKLLTSSQKRKINLLSLFLIKLKLNLYV